jgi:phosphoribosyl-dephospho-CoA transferase
MADALRRHDLVWLDAAGWQQALAAPDLDSQAHNCLAHWAAHGLPLVVTRQPAQAGSGAAAAPLVLGLAAPQRWQRRRLFVETTMRAVQRRGSFPTAAALAPLLAPAARAPWLRWCSTLEAQGLAPRVYGSHGWQLATGLPCTHAASDIDLLLHATGANDADAAVALLQAAPCAAPRLDGEIVFADGAAVAWREWAAWRAGRTAQLLVKRLRGASLEAPALVEATA